MTSSAAATMFVIELQSPNDAGAGQSSPSDKESQRDADSSSTPYAPSPVLAKPGDAVRLVRDADRQVDVILTSTASSPASGSGTSAGGALHEGLRPPGDDSSHVAKGMLLLLLQDWRHHGQDHSPGTSGDLPAKISTDSTGAPAGPLTGEGTTAAVATAPVASFRVTVNDITYDHGPIPLAADDVVLLCEWNAFTDAYRFVVREVSSSSSLPEPQKSLSPLGHQTGAGTAEKEDAASDRVEKLPLPIPAEADAAAAMGNASEETEAAAIRDAMFLQECSKWSNFYNYRYSTTNFALRGESREAGASSSSAHAEEYRRYIGLHPQEGCPSILVMSHIHSSALMPGPLDTDGFDGEEGSAEKGFKMKRNGCGCGCGARVERETGGGTVCFPSLCPVCRGMDEGTRQAALENSRAFLQELRTSSSCGADSASVGGVKAAGNSIPSPGGAAFKLGGTGSGSGAAAERTTTTSSSPADPWLAYTTERRRRLFGSAAAGSLPPSGQARPAAGVPSGGSASTTAPLGGRVPPPDAKAVCQRIEQLERLMAGTRYQ